VRTDDAPQTVLAAYTYGDTNQRLVCEEGTARTYYVAEGGQVLAEYTEYFSSYYSSTTPGWSK